MSTSCVLRISETIPCKGTGKNIVFYNGKSEGGLCIVSNYNLEAKNNNIAKTVGSTYSDKNWTNSDRTTIGLTLDGTKSGIVADISSMEIPSLQIGIYCIKA